MPLSSSATLFLILVNLTLVLDCWHAWSHAERKSTRRLAKSTVASLRPSLLRFCNQTGKSSIIDGTAAIRRLTNTPTTAVNAAAISFALILISFGHTREGNAHQILKLTYMHMKNRRRQEFRSILAAVGFDCFLRKSQRRTDRSELPMNRRLGSG